MLRLIVNRAFGFEGRTRLSKDWYDKKSVIEIVVSRDQLVAWRNAVAAMRAHVPRVARRWVPFAADSDATTWADGHCAPLQELPFVRTDLSKWRCERLRCRASSEEVNGLRKMTKCARWSTTRRAHCGAAG